MGRCQGEAAAGRHRAVSGVIHNGAYQQGAGVWAWAGKIVLRMGFCFTLETGQAFSKSAHQDVWVICAELLSCVSHEKVLGQASFEWGDW